MTGQLPATVHQRSVVIEAERLLLRSYRDEDLADLVALAGNWQVACWLTNLPHPYCDGHGRDWIAHVRRQSDISLMSMTTCTGGFTGAFGVAAVVTAAVAGRCEVAQRGGGADGLAVRGATSRFIVC
jgi:RimJ/RimL family protein N-acetyltransferase